MSSPPPRCSSLRTGRTASICSPPSSAGLSSFRWHLLVELRWKEKMHINRSIPRNHLEWSQLFAPNYTLSGWHVVSLLQVGLKVEWGAGAGTWRYKEGELQIVTHAKKYKCKTQMHLVIKLSPEQTIKDQIVSQKNNQRATALSWASLDPLSSVPCLY